MSRLDDAVIFRMPTDQRQAFQDAYEQDPVAPSTLLVPVYLDFISPFSFLATRQTESLEAELNVEFDFRPWEVYPEWKPYAAWLDDPEMRKRIWASSNALLRRYGLPVPDERASFRPRTRALHEAVEYARNVDLAKPYVKAVFWAYFIDQRDVRELDVLGQIAEGVGMIRRDLEDSVLNGRFSDVVDEHEEHARLLGVFGVPTYVINEQTIWGRDMLEAVREALLAAGATKR